MNSSQQYELKVGVLHYPSLKTQQLIQFLENQSNQFLTNDLPHSLTQDNFITIFQSLPHTQTFQYEQYVGLLLLYSSASIDSYQFIKTNIPNSQTLNDLFLIIVQMDNTDKKTNAIGDEGERLCKKMNYQFVRLTLYNSDQLVTTFNRNLYELIQNYYYPNQQEKPSKQYQSQYNFQYTQSPEQVINHHEELMNQQKVEQSPKNTKKVTKSKIIATKQNKKSIQKLLDKASELRESRQQLITSQQQQIDEAINNVQDVLNNIDSHLQQKVTSPWYTSLKHTLFSPLEKNSTSFAKIKLTQQFIEQRQEDQQVYGIFTGNLPTNSHPPPKKVLSKIMQPIKPTRDAIINKFINTNKKKQSLMKIILVVADSVIVELQVYEHSTYDELVMNGLKKLGITESQHNFNIMRDVLVGRIQDFVKELSRAVKNTERIRMEERSFLNRKQETQDWKTEQQQQRWNTVPAQFYSFK